MVYEFTVTPDAAQDTTFITFDESNMRVSWSNSGATVGTYTIVIKGQVSNSHTSSPFSN